MIVEMAIRAVGENIRYCLDRTDGSIVEPKKPGKNKINHTKIATKSRGYSLRKWCHEKGRDGTSVPKSLS